MSGCTYKWEDLSVFPYEFKNGSNDLEYEKKKQDRVFCLCTGVLMFPMVVR